MILRLTLFIFILLQCTLVFADQFDTVIRAKLPDGIKTVSEAGQYYAETIGYKLISNDISEIKTLAKSNKLTTIRKALLNLIGKDKVIIIDYENKQIMFCEKDKIF